MTPLIILISDILSTFTCMKCVNKLCRISVSPFAIHHRSIFVALNIERKKIIRNFLLMYRLCDYCDDDDDDAREGPSSWDDCSSIEPMPMSIP